ncbi:MULTISPECIES: PTS transporter subunit IIC [Mammaliicoccus]|uniref:PTS galactitol transporter subunit IIC n=1 Tax=Mammaliicoccus TaxID=2803850 RepID=UPI000E68947D|nr:MULTISPECIES: PTS transporter subunit IIC [Mammaliicoccus]RIO17960.1 PTS galactitol transporter subunit IIC [Mammaliicoccus sciuri]
METLKIIVNYVLDLGAAVFVPLIMLVIGMIVRMKFKDALSSAITLGVAFTGMMLVVGFMLDAISPAAKELAKLTGITLTAIDGGWTGMASISWAWPYAFLMFPLTVGINIIMLLLNLTKTLNVDMWNVWNKIFTAVMVSAISGSMIMGFIVAGIQVILELKAGDAWGDHINKLTGIPGITVPHFITLLAVILYPLNRLMDLVPFLNKKMDADALKEKIGVFAENHIMGGIIGLLLGFAAGYGVSGSLGLAIKAAAAMTLFPMVSKLFMQALSPISDAVSEFMRKKFSGREVFIGLDWPVLAGRNELWVTAIILIPISILFAITLPGNKVLPFAGIINISFFVAAFLITGGNLLRMIIMGIITTPIFLYAATFFAPFITDLANSTGVVKVKEGTQLTWSTFEGPDFRYIFGLAAEGNIVFIALAIVWLGAFYWMYKGMIKKAKSYADSEAL